MKTFPIMLAGEGLRAVVVGGGPVGLRKAKALLRAGAEVTLVDPRPFAETAGNPKHRSNLRVVAEPYRRSRLRGARLVMACTNDRELNRRIAADARAAGALVNAADQPEGCDFFLPAIVRDGDVVVAIGTGGAAPALAGTLKRRLRAAMPPRIGAFAAAVSGLRAKLRKDIPDPHRRMAILRRLCGHDAYSRFIAGGRKALLAMAKRAVRKAGRGPAPRAQR